MKEKNVNKNEFDGYTIHHSSLEEAENIFKILESRGYETVLSIDDMMLFHRGEWPEINHIDIEGSDKKVFRCPVERASGKTVVSYEQFVNYCLGIGELPERKNRLPRVSGYYGRLVKDGDIDYLIYGCHKMAVRDFERLYNIVKNIPDLGGVVIKNHSVSIEQLKQIHECLEKDHNTVYHLEFPAETQGEKINFK